VQQRREVAATRAAAIPTKPEAPAVAKPQAVPGPIATPQPVAQAEAKPPAGPQEAGYTSRLLEAKRKMWQERRGGEPLRPEAPPEAPDSDRSLKDRA
jgi:hypothetical protein